MDLSKMSRREKCDYYNEHLMKKLNGMKGQLENMAEIGKKARLIAAENIYYNIQEMVNEAYELGVLITCENHNINN